jgi:glycosyltransferase involved in cell wall biosynthesis
MPRISAVIITYNEEQFIEKCLASLEGITDKALIDRMKESILEIKDK